MADHDPESSAATWRNADRIFAAALEQPEKRRQAFVHERCVGDPDLLAQVKALLEAAARSEGLFESPGSSAVVSALVGLDRHGDPVLDRIGPYTVVRELGRGGMGSVYLAERQGEGFRQQVAIKLMRRGLDTDDIVNRFLRERRILGNLTHPGIARLIDGGATQDGRSYLAMEYVHGEPITAWCDHRRVDLAGRLALFLQVADAVRAAHASLIVHRDLKPSNILVSNGQVKLLDFGIAKLLDDEAAGAEHTRTGVFLMTPEVASPEQLRGAPVTTATDIYQLGILLCQLLTGARPFARPDPQDAERSGRYGPARRPSAIVDDGESGRAAARDRRTSAARLRRALRGDLDTIVLEAVHEEPARRYASVDLLAGDIRRFLAGEPISARRDTWTYRVRTLARRHPWVAPVAGLTLLTLFGYAATLTWSVVRLTQAQAVAQQEAERAQAVQTFLVDLFRSADPNNPADAERGRQITVVEALDVGVERLRTELTDEPVIREALLVAIADVYQNLDVLDRARPVREEALALQEARAPGSVEHIRNLGLLAHISSLQGADEEASGLYERRLALARALDPPQAVEVARAQLEIAQQAIAYWRLGEADEHIGDALALAAAGGVPAPLRAELHRTQADLHRKMGRLDDARQAAEQALALRVGAHGEDAVEVALARITLGQAFSGLGQSHAALAHHEAAFETLERRLGADNWQTLVAVNSLALSRWGAGDLEGAVTLLRQLVERRRRVQGEQRKEVGDALQNLAVALTEWGRVDEARGVYAQAAEVYLTALGPDNFLVALPRLSLAGLELQAGQYRAAEDAARAARGVLRNAAPDGHYVTAIAECRVALALIGQGRLADAAPFVDASVAVLVGAEAGAEPRYRDECLRAAAAFFDSRGQPERGVELRQALASR